MIINVRFLKYRLAGSSKPKIFEESSEEEEDEETPEQRGKMKYFRQIHIFPTTGLTLLFIRAFYFRKEKSLRGKKKRPLSRMARCTTGEKTTPRAR